jgi:hypothetical protein
MFWTLARVRKYMFPAKARGMDRIKNRITIAI